MCSCSQRPSGHSSWISGLLLVIPAVALPILFTPAPAEAQAFTATAKAQRHQTGQRTQAGQTAGRYRETGRYRGSKAQQQLDAHRNRHQNRGSVSLIGGAANVDPDLYLELGVESGHPVVPLRRGHRRGYRYQQPYVVYINDEAVEPQIYGEPTYAEPAPQPIYIVQQPPQVVQVPAPAAQAPAPAPVAPEPAPEPRPRSTEPQSIALQIVPADARVYLDDELLGPASAVASTLTSLAPGIYVLEVSHGDYPPQRLVFGVSTDPVSIAIDLTADRPSRRSRVK